MSPATALSLRWLGRALAGLGALGLISLGALVAWHVWVEHTTGAITQAAQQRLADDLQRPGGDQPVVGDVGAAAAGASTLELGAAVGELSFSRHGRQIVSDPLVVVEGVGTHELTLGPGHYPSTPLPGVGTAGNVAIAGHRTTYGAPFRDLDRLRDGDVATFATAAGTHRYRVVGQRVVAPADTSVLDPDPLGTGAATLTLTTCDPPGTAARRLIVVAERLS